MDFKIPVAADQGGVVSANFIEVPIKGPGRANLLVVVTGIAIVASDEDAWHTLTGGGEGAHVRGEIFIETNYKLRDSDVLLDQASIVTLASIQGDDDPDFTVAVDSVEASPRTSNVIQIHTVAASFDDVSILRISYQANLLVMRI